MTVATTSSSATFPWTGVETSFPCGFPAKGAADLALTVTGADEIPRPLLLGVHYTVAFDAGTQLATVLPIAGSFGAGMVLVRRQTPSVQQTVFSDSESVPASTHEDVADRAAMRDQDMRRDVDTLSAALLAAGVPVAPPVNQAIRNLPLGPYINPFTGLAGAPLISAATTRSLRAVSALDDGIEFMDAVVLDVTKGAGALGAGRAKVAQFISAQSVPGGGDAYAVNANVSVGKNVGDYHGIVNELDLNNGNKHYGDNGSGLAGEDQYMTALYVNGLAGTDGGGALYRSTGCGVFNINGWAPNWGFIFGPHNNAMLGGLPLHSVIAKCTIEDQTDGGFSYVISGNKSAAGFDTTGASFATGMAMRLGGGHGIAWKDAGGADHLYLKNDAGNNFVIGEGAASLSLKTSALPSVDNSAALGTSLLAWSDVATHHVTTISDAATKLDIADVPPVLPFVRALQPKTYREKLGGFNKVETLEERDVPVVETDTFERLKIRVEDGLAHVEGTETVSVPRPVIDHVPVLEDGKPVMVELRAGHLAHFDQDRIFRPGRPPIYWPKTHPVPRTEKKQVAVVTDVPREGVKEHFGLVAGDVQAALAKFFPGRNIGAFVKGRDGAPDAVRYPQFVPVALAAIAELADALDKANARIAALEART